MSFIICQIGSRRTCKRQKNKRRKKSKWIPRSKLKSKRRNLSTRYLGTKVLEKIRSERGNLKFINNSTMIFDAVLIFLFYLKTIPCNIEFGPKLENQKEYFTICDLQPDWLQHQMKFLSKWTLIFLFSKSPFNLELYHASSAP